MDALERIRAALPLSEEEDARIEATRTLVRDVADELRTIFEALPSDELRKEVLLALAVCEGCGAQFGTMYDLRGWWTCNCYQEQTP